MDIARLPVRACVRYGWETFKKRPWFIIGIGIVISALNLVIPAPEEGQPAIVAISVFLISFLLGSLLQLGATNFGIRVHDNVSTAQAKDLWRPELFWAYLGATILSGILILLGLVLLIIPGIIIGLALSFATYLVIDKGLGPVAALKQSWSMTHGNRWRLFLLVMLLVLLNIVGALALLVGLLVTIPVSMIASVHAYRFLEQAHDDAIDTLVDDASAEEEVVEEVSAEVAAA